MEGVTKKENSEFAVHYCNPKFDTEILCSNTPFIEEVYSDKTEEVTCQKCRDLILSQTANFESMNDDFPDVDED